MGPTGTSIDAEGDVGQGCIVRVRDKRCKHWHHRPYLKAMLACNNATSNHVGITLLPILYLIWNYIDIPPSPNTNTTFLQYSGCSLYLALAFIFPLLSLPSLSAFFQQYHLPLSQSLSISTSPSLSLPLSIFPLSYFNLSLPPSPTISISPSLHLPLSPSLLPSISHNLHLSLPPSADLLLLSSTSLSTDCCIPLHSFQPKGLLEIILTWMYPCN